MYLDVGHLASILFGTLCASWTCMSVSFTKLGEFTFIIFSNRFPISCSFSSSSGTPWCECWNAWSCPRGCLHYSCFFGFFFLCIVLIDCFLLPYVPYHWFDSQLHPLFCCFPVNCCLFQLLFLHFWLDLFYTVEVLTKFLEHCYNQYFEFYISKITYFHFI